MSENLYIGASRSDQCIRTIGVVLEKLRRLSPWKGERLLDIGCGDGTFTFHLGEQYAEIFGIDVQEDYVATFNERAASGSKFRGSIMSASAMEFPADFFDTIVTIETLEHVADLAGTAREIHRVLRPGGELIITVPNRWFPCENHGMAIGSFEMSRAPLLTYLPWLHRKWGKARVFKVRDLDNLFVPLGLKRAAVDYAWPTFEHGGNRIQSLLKPLFGTMRWLEHAPMPLRMFGTSVIVKYVKNQPPATTPSPQDVA